MKVVTSDQMRQMEARAGQAGVPTDTLMENAGLAVAQRVRHHLGHLAGAPVVVLVGPGNNGGDGLVVARHLHRWGARVLVYLCAPRRTPDPKLELAQDQGVPVMEASDDTGLTWLRKSLASAHMVVDAVLGTGRARPIQGTLRDALLALSEEKARRRDLRVLALDLPTGLNADTGAVDPACPAADVTVTLGYPKVGLLLYPGADFTGALETVDIGIPAGLDRDIGLELMGLEWARARLPRRPSSAHKGTFGRTLVVAGSRNFIGAVYLAATAATRVGAGLVTIATPASLQAPIAARAIEPTYLPLPEAEPGVPAPDAAGLVLEGLGDYSALLVGCGMGQAQATREFLSRLLFSGAALPPAIIDADGLNFLSTSQAPGWWERCSYRAIVTPHPGEMARLLGESTEAVQQDRIGKARGAAVRWNKVVVLKGAYTIVAFPDGRAMLSPFANAGLATAGTGDVLAGAMAGLLSQGLALEDAAALAVYIHGLAGERVRAELGDTGMVASDLLPVLPRVIRDLRQGDLTP